MKSIIFALSFFFSQFAMATLDAIPGDTHFAKITELFSKGTLIDLASMDGKTMSGRCFASHAPNNAVASYFAVHPTVDNLGPIADAPGVYYIGFAIDIDAPANGYDEDQVFDRHGYEARRTDAVTHSIQYNLSETGHFRKSGSYLVARFYIGSDATYNCYYFRHVTNTK